MSKKLKSKPVNVSRKIKHVEETTKTYEHQCTPACFKQHRIPPPPDLRRVSLGYVYVSSDGGFIRSGETMNGCQLRGWILSICTAENW
jgi:hypothetical protein